MIIELNFFTGTGYHTHITRVKLVRVYDFSRVYNSLMNSEKSLFRTSFCLYLVIVQALNRHGYRAQAHQFDFL